MSKRDLQQALCYCMDVLSVVSEYMDRASNKIKKYRRGNIGDAL